MRRKILVLLMLLMCVLFLTTSCGGTPPSDEVNSTLEMTQTPPADPVPEDLKGEIVFSSMENAYYSKYMELAEKHGTYSLYDSYRVKGDYSGRSYLCGVCVVNLMDFNGDGVQDLFVVYSNGKMDRITDHGFDLEICDLPVKDSYEFEIWTYVDGGLKQILHESSVSLCYTYPNDKSDFCQKYYQNFITVYENRDGFPVIQIYEEGGGERKHTNIYYSGGQIVRDQLVYNGDTIQMNGREVTEAVWSENAAGYHKILLCSLLVDSHRSSSDLLEGYHLDYNTTLLQTERVIRYLSEEKREPVMPRFYIQEGEYISSYLQELERANRVRLGPETIANHFFDLYDMNQDGVPELILYEGSSGAGTHYHFFTFMDGKSVNCGEYGRTSLYGSGEGGLIAYFGHMGSYQIEKIELADHAVSITPIASGENQNNYPELEEFGYGNWEPLPFCPPAIPLALYTYNQELSK